MLENHDNLTNPTLPRKPEGVSSWLLVNTKTLGFEDTSRQE